MYCTTCKEDTPSILLSHMKEQCYICATVHEARIFNQMAVRRSLASHGLRKGELLVEFIDKKITAGVPLTTISKWANRSHAWCTVFLKGQNISLKLPKNKNKCKYAISELRTMLSLGFSPIGFCRHFNVSHATYYRWKKQIKETPK